MVLWTSSINPTKTQTASAPSASTLPVRSTAQVFEELEPRSFSFNSPFGACPECSGLGTRMEVDRGSHRARSQPSLAEGAIGPWTSAAHVASTSGGS